MRSLAFVLRCACSAAASYQLALWLGLPVPVWASVSALVIAQDRWSETRVSLHERVRGTLLGVAVSLAVNIVAISLRLPAIVQLMVAVAVCAAVARAERGLRVCMWTCPIVLLSAHAGAQPAIVTGLLRAFEIMVGCFVGGVFHFLAERLLALEFTRERERG
ncbi:FUSC family protein [Paraburkholderia acidisoli]|uniref:FUSC family protein n=1 Tax=Paraburkholderia acidisoli TaxID=2571748 RepID=A0A7Z2GJX4_9BURK|nr:FUSC family protein [Paraburkholderia acidisoli]QGZ63088.1 FUSC family protein [Paraburkholderia acidisoli]